MIFNIIKEDLLINKSITLRSKIIYFMGYTICSIGKVIDADKGHYKWFNYKNKGFFIGNYIIRFYFEDDIVK